MTDPFEELKRLEDRVKKAEDSIEASKILLDSKTKELTDAKQELIAQSGKLAKYINLEVALQEVVGGRLTPISSGASGTIGSQAIEVKDPSQIIEVSDPKEPLKVNTTELRGQIAKLILEGRIESTLVNAKAVRGKLVAEFGTAGEGWDIDTVLKELKALAAPPFRLFSFSPKNYMFRLRTGSEKRVKE